LDDDDVDVVVYCANASPTIANVAPVNTFDGNGWTMSALRYASKSAEEYVPSTANAHALATPNNRCCFFGSTDNDSDDMVLSSFNVVVSAARSVMTSVLLDVIVVVVVVAIDGAWSTFPTDETIAPNKDLVNVIGVVADTASLIIFLFVAAEG
jgi:hypothetical protein